MSTTIAQARVKRLVNLGLVDTSCTPTERINQLKSRIREDERSFRRLKDFFSALGDATRLKMLKLMADEELCSCEIMAALELTQPTTSHHLGILERAGLLTSKRNGKWVFYKIANSRAHSLIDKGFGLVEVSTS
ncbi:MAG: ArsR/SmtB family transcription factor [Candidatus Bathyarchaeia archaeon]